MQASGSVASLGFVPSRAWLTVPIISAHYNNWFWSPCLPILVLQVAQPPLPQLAEVVDHPVSKGLGFRVHH